MLKTIRSTSLLLMALFLMLASIWLLTRQKTDSVDRRSWSANEMLTYIIPRSWGDPSFDPVDSDAIANAAHMEQLIGTLTKMGKSGKYEPYLAHSWEQNDGGRSWRFRLHSNLTCSDGSVIDAQSYVRSFQTILPVYAASTTVPVFSQLKGWEAFLRGETEALGIRAEGQLDVVFEFSEKPNAGLLEYLSMPYYGFFCANNFENGKWKNSKSIISSGAYSLDQLEQDQTITLKKRSNHLVNSTAAPTLVRIRRLDKPDALKLKPEKTIIHTVLSGEEKINEQWIHSTGVPTNLIGFTFGKKEESPLNDVHIRRYIQQILLQELPKNAIGSYSPAQSFYFDSAIPKFTVPEKNDPPKTQFDGVIKILTGPQKNKSPMLHVLEQMVSSALSKLELKYEFYGLDLNDPNYTARYTSNDEWDIRLFNVSTGSTPKNWVVRMMFCSKMGINFNDSAGRICDLVNRFDLAAFDQTEYVREFEKIIFEEATVIPLFHMRQTWLYSDDLDLSQVSSTVDIPLFELIGVRR